MSEDRLGLVDAKRLAALGTVQTHCVPLGSFPRVAEMLAATEGDADIHLRWHLVGTTTCCELGVAARLPLVCQRCLKPFAYVLETQAQLALVADDATQGPEGYELLVQDANRVDCLAMVEDELLLALPVLAMHGEDSTCAGRVAVRAEVQEEPGETRRPFAGLKDLMKH